MTPVVTRTPQPPVTSFLGAGLPQRLVTALARRGVTEPFAIQARALPDALAGHDLLGRAATGSGKTLAFGLPLLARLLDASGQRGRAPRGLVLVPTRELAQQVTDVLAPLAQPLGLKVAAVYGGASLGRQVSAMRAGVDVVIATPGRLQDLLDRQAVTLDAVEVTVLDEADHLCDLGFLPAVRRLLDRTQPGGQRMLFSATLDGDVDVLVRAYLVEPVLVDVESGQDAVGDVDYRLLVVRDRDAKLALTAELAGGEGRRLLFVRTKHGADRLARQLSRAGVAAWPLHGGMAQNARTKALAGFTEGSTPVLVATDVAARGLHVDDIDLVLHVDLPTEAKTFRHRSGRTGRAGADGSVAVIALEDELGAATTLLRQAGVEAAVSRPVVTPLPRDAVMPFTAAPVPATSAPVGARPARAAAGGGGRPSRPTTGFGGPPRPRAGRRGEPMTWRSESTPATPRTDRGPRRASRPQGSASPAA